MTILPGAWHTILNKLEWASWSDDKMKDAIWNIRSSWTQDRVLNFAWLHLRGTCQKLPLHTKMEFDQKIWQMTFRLLGLHWTTFSVLPLGSISWALFQTFLPQKVQFRACDVCGRFSESLSIKLIFFHWICSSLRSWLILLCVHNASVVLPPDVDVLWWVGWGLMNVCCLFV